MAELDNLLDSIAGTDGVRAVVVAGADGLMIDGRQKGGQEDLNALAALAASVAGSVQSMGSDMGRGELKEVIAEFGDASVLLQPVGGDASVLVVAGPGGNIGRLRFMLRRRGAEVGQAIAQL